MWWKIDNHLKSGEGTHWAWLGLLVGSDVGYKVGCSVLFCRRCKINNKKMLSEQISNQQLNIRKESPSWEHSRLQCRAQCGAQCGTERGAERWTQCGK